MPKYLTWKEFFRENATGVIGIIKAHQCDCIIAIRPVSSKTGSKTSIEIIMMGLSDILLHTIVLHNSLTLTFTLCQEHAIMVYKDAKTCLYRNYISTGQKTASSRLTLFNIGLKKYSNQMYQHVTIHWPSSPIFSHNAWIIFLRTGVEWSFSPCNLLLFL